LEVVEHFAVDQNRRLEAGAAKHHAMARRYHLRAGEVRLQPGDDELHRGLVIDRGALAPGVGVQRLAGGVIGDEMWIGLHAVDAAMAQEWQGLVCVQRIGAELQAGGARVEDDDGLGHADHSAISGSKMAGSRASASAYSTVAAAEKRRAAGVSARPRLASRRSATCAGSARRRRSRFLRTSCFGPTEPSKDHSQ